MPARRYFLGFLIHFRRQSWFCLRTFEAGLEADGQLFFTAFYPEDGLLVITPMLVKLTKVGLLESVKTRLSPRIVLVGLDIILCDLSHLTNMNSEHEHELPTHYG